MLNILHTCGANVRANPGSIINQPYVAAQCGKYSGVCIFSGRKSNSSHVSLCAKKKSTAYPKIVMKLKMWIIPHPFNLNLRLKSHLSSHPLSPAVFVSCLFDFTLNYFYGKPCRPRRDSCQRSCPHAGGACQTAKMRGERRNNDRKKALYSTLKAGYCPALPYFLALSFHEAPLHLSKQALIGLVDFISRPKQTAIKGT